MQYSSTLGAVYDYFMYFLERFYLRSRRARLISKLSGKILEVGVGTGANFKHYNQDIQLIGIEPSPHMILRAKEKIKECLEGNGSNCEGPLMDIIKQQWAVFSINKQEGLFRASVPKTSFYIVSFDLFLIYAHLHILLYFWPLKGTWWNVKWKSKIGDSIP